VAQRFKRVADRRAIAGQSLWTARDISDEGLGQPHPPVYEFGTLQPRQSFGKGSKAPKKFLQIPWSSTNPALHL
jgi:hypothetical protein